jgi:Xaa-Pro aminopeptidase
MNFDRVSQLDETAEKRVRLLRLMKERAWGAVVFTRRANFAWVSGGSDNHVRHGSDMGVASLIIFLDGRKVVFTSNIEAPRIMDEELGGLGFELVQYQWFSPRERSEALASLLRTTKAASDDGTPGTEDIEPWMPGLRMRLSRHELAKYRWLGKATGQGIGDVCRKITRGMSEEEIAGMLFSTLQAKSVKASVMLVAADDRLTKYRHPIPTPEKVKHAVMLVVCARRWGLVCSATRIVGFGKSSPDLRRKHEACVYVDATFIAASRPGVSMVEVFERGRTAYAERGFPNEWRHHHQGGPTGYAEREFTVCPETPKEQKVEVGMAFAWNPSIAGTKSEDTILVTAKGSEIMTTSPGWPMMKVAVAGKTILRPDWLVKA